MKLDLKSLSERHCSGPCCSTFQENPRELLIEESESGSDP